MHKFTRGPSWLILAASTLKNSGDLESQHDGCVVQHEG